jgi:preprotein translocase subunit YajC
MSNPSKQEIIQQMQLDKLAYVACAAALAAAPLALSPLVAATTAEVQPGMQVVDPSGGVVGQVTGLKGNMLILRTDKHEVQLPLTSFTANEGKLLFGMTAAQLNAETEKAMAAANAAVAVGANVYGSDGTLAGTIEEIDDSLVKIKLASGSSVRLPRSGVAGSAKGAVLGVTTAQLNQLATQAAAPPEAAAPDSVDGKGN